MQLGQPLSCAQDRHAGGGVLLALDVAGPWNRSHSVTRPSAQRKSPAFDKMGLQVRSHFNYKPTLVSPRVLLGISLLLLTLSGVFGYLNTGKIKALRAEMESANAAQAMAENGRIAHRTQSRGNEANATSQTAQATDAQARAASAEAEVARAQSEKAAALAKLQTTETELTQLQKRVQENGASRTETRGATVADLQAQLDDARRQLENAEREKIFVAEKTQGSHQGSVPAPSTEERVQLPRRRTSSSSPGLHGTILAVNQAYNFVVLNLGSRQGVETNAELMVMRRGAVIGRIRLSSVEPATSIGDIIGSSLPRGVQVQPGDIVVYVGTDS